MIAQNFHHFHMQKHSMDDADYHTVEGKQTLDPL
jgi:hypothetical protein